MGSVIVFKLLWREECYKSEYIRERVSHQPSEHRRPS